MRPCTNLQNEHVPWSSMVHVRHGRCQFSARTSNTSAPEMVSTLAGSSSSQRWVQNENGHTTLSIPAFQTLSPHKSSRFQSTQASQTLVFAEFYEPHHQKSNRRTQNFAFHLGFNTTQMIQNTNPKGFFPQKNNAYAAEDLSPLRGIDSGYQVITINVALVAINVTFFQTVQKV